MQRWGLEEEGVGDRFYFYFLNRDGNGSSLYEPVLWPDSAKDRHSDVSLTALRDVRFMLIRVLTCLRKLAWFICSRLKRLLVLLFGCPIQHCGCILKFHLHTSQGSSEISLIEEEFSCSARLFSIICEHTTSCWLHPGPPLWFCTC